MAYNEHSKNKVSSGGSRPSNKWGGGGVGEGAVIQTLR